jgi:FkbM family methyltransferase
VVGYAGLRRGARAVAQGAGAAIARERALRFEPAGSATPAADGTADRVEIAGVVWWVPPDERRASSLSDRVLRGTLPMLELIRTGPYLRGGVMIDIGANIGTTAIPRVLLGDAACVYAAEPEPANAACLRRAVVENHLDGFVMVDQVAIGDRDGHAELLRARRLGSHRLSSGAPATDRAVPVQSLRLDAWSRRLGSDLERVTYIKCDTQGWEGRVLAGAERLLSRTDIVWEIEICPALLEAAGTPARELYRTVSRAFRWFIDLRGEGADAARRPTSALEARIAAMLAAGHRYTNVLLFNDLPPGPRVG